MRKLALLALLVAAPVHAASPTQVHLVSGPGGVWSTYGTDETKNCHGGGFDSPPFCDHDFKQYLATIDANAAVSLPIQVSTDPSVELLPFGMGALLTTTAGRSFVDGAGTITPIALPASTATSGWVGTPEGALWLEEDAGALYVHRVLQAGTEPAPRRLLPGVPPFAELVVGGDRVLAIWESGYRLHALRLGLDGTPLDVSPIDLPGDLDRSSVTQSWRAYGRGQGWAVLHTVPPASGTGPYEGRLVLLGADGVAAAEEVVEQTTRLAPLGEGACEVAFRDPKNDGHTIIEARIRAAAGTAGAFVTLTDDGTYELELGSDGKRCAVHYRDTRDVHRVLRFDAATLATPAKGAIVSDISTGMGCSMTGGASASGASTAMLVLALVVLARRRYRGAV